MKRALSPVRKNAALSSFFALMLAMIPVGSAFASPMGEPIEDESRNVELAESSKDAWDFFEALPNGYGEDALKVLNLSPIKEYTHKGEAGDATSLQNMQDSVQWLKKCNELRAQNGLGALKVNYTLLAIAMTDANYSLSAMGHANKFNCGENLSWGYADPFKGWYDEEKAKYDAGNRNQADVGHYLNIINPKNQLVENITYGNTGFAIVKGGNFGIEHAQTFGSLDSNWTPAYQKDLPAGLTFGAATKNGNISVEDYERQLAAFANGESLGSYTGDGDDNGADGSGDAITPDDDSAGGNDGNNDSGIVDAAAPSAPTNDAGIGTKNTTLSATGDTAGFVIAIVGGLVLACIVAAMAWILKKQRIGIKPKAR